MGQKISPIALRLQTNKHFHATWYSDRMYANLTQKQIQLQKFLTKVFQQAGTRASTTHLSQQPAALSIQSFFCSPRVFDSKVEKKNVELKLTSFFQNYRTKQWQFLPNQLDWKAFEKKLWFQLVLDKKNSTKLDELVSYKNTIQSAKTEKSPQLKFYANHLEGLTQQYFETPSNWTPKKLTKFSKSAQFVAELIAHGLEVQKPVKQIFSLVQTLLKKDSNVEGFKLSCSGRLQGVEMAKTEVKKFGKISLHVFSSKVDYAEARASTGFGILGVKVWICYKD